MVFGSGCAGPISGFGCFGLGGGVGGAAALFRLQVWLCHGRRRCGEVVVVLLRWSRWVAVSVGVGVVLGWGCRGGVVGEVLVPGGCGGFCLALAVASVAVKVVRCCGTVWI
jgi:hypothetical protein